MSVDVCITNNYYHYTFPYRKLVVISKGKLTWNQTHCFELFDAFLSRKLQENKQDISSKGQSTATNLQCHASSKATIYGTEDHNCYNIIILQQIETDYSDDVQLLLYLKAVAIGFIILLW